MFDSETTSTATLLIQRTWRGARARRGFTELLFAALQEQIREDFSHELVELPEETPALPALRGVGRSSTPSLEEALEEASVLQFYHPGSPSPRKPASQPDSAQTNPVAHKPPQPSPHVCASSSEASSPKPTTTTPNAAPGLTPASIARMGSLGDGMGSAGASAGEDLRFTEELAADMSVEALRELAAVLGRLSAARNKLLVTQLEKRDELLHEREHRQTLVEQLLLQVDRSRSLRRPKPGKR